jgi:hypothetical protein
MNPKVKKVRQSLALVIILTLVAGFASCEKVGLLPAPFNKDTAWSFKADIQPIFSGSKCTDCHNGTRSPDLRSGKSYAALTGVVKYVNAPESAESSRLYLKMTSSSGSVNHSIKTTENEKLTVLYWIKQGAQYN